MSQTVRITEINGALYPQIFTAFHDYEEAISMVTEMIEDGFILPSDDYYEVVTVWYEIGEGESGTDVFFSDEELLEMINKGIFVREVEKAGYEIELITDDNIKIRADELEELDE